MDYSTVSFNIEMINLINKSKQWRFLRIHLANSDDNSEAKMRIQRIGHLGVSGITCGLQTTLYQSQLICSTESICDFCFNYLMCIWMLSSSIFVLGLKSIYFIMGCAQVNQNMSWTTSNSAYGGRMQQGLIGSSGIRSHIRGSSSPQKYGGKPKGLENLGNTCYISAVLQILFQILDEKELQVRSKHQQEITSLFFELKKTKDTRDYKMFKRALEDRVEIVQGWDQQDGHELLIHLLEQIGKENPLPVKRGSGKVDLNYHQKDNYRKNWQRFVGQNLKLENTKIISLFYGEILKRFTCPYKHQKHNFQRYMDLSLPFTPKSSTSQYSSSYSIQGPLKVTDMLHEFLGEQQIEGLFCEMCKKKMKFKKESVLYSTPKFMKGFYSNEKNKREVEFDDSIELKERNGEKNVKFRLMGIVYHEGSMNRGHYFADVRTDNDWFEMNDEKVFKSEVKERRNISNSVYLLIYQKIE